MTFIAILLVILSAGIHALWNFLSKSTYPSAAFFLLASIFGTVLLSPILIHHREIILNIPSQVWLLLVIAGLFMTLYYNSLAKAYREGDLSVAYPIVRALPIVLVFAIVVLIGRANQITALSVVGGLLVALGCFMVPLKQLKTFNWRNYWNITCAMALIAAISSAGYSLVDDEALHILRSDSSLAIDNTSATIIYAFLEALITSIWMAVFILMNKQSRADFSHVLQAHKMNAFLAGVGIHLSYTLLLGALAFVDNVSYVVAFHRLSIPIGAALGILILKEKPYSVKLWGVLIVLLGLTAVALG